MLTGKNFVAGERRASGAVFHAIDAHTGKPLETPFCIAGDDDVSDACGAAARDQHSYASIGTEQRAAFLRKVAQRIDALGDTLTQRAMAETGLPQARLEGERGRTVGQLRMFADYLETGDWQRARIDHADSARTPPKPDLRLRMIPTGPVAVFGASNFPLAFSVAGGDTSSALAAGCCVVVKGHPAHPGTSELVAGAIAQAIGDCGLPDGVFSLLNGPGNDLGEALVKDPRITAVGFTGSRAGGLALMKHAAARHVPIPVFAEMSSVNPVILLPGRLNEAAEDLGRLYAGSLSLGAGQFCTNPGIVLGLAGDALERFKSSAADALLAVPAQTMLTAGIRKAFEAGVTMLSSQASAAECGSGAAGAEQGAQARIFAVSGSDFLANPRLADEVFGPVSIIVECSTLEQLHAIVHAMEGQLTATLHINEADYEAARNLLPALEDLAGRIIANGWPTGVDVTHAMVHGGPFPATSDPRSTSVGTLAVERFLRPVSYQDMPAALLPESLREGEGRVDGARLIDGKLIV